MLLCGGCPCSKHTRKLRILLHRCPQLLQRSVVRIFRDFCGGKSVREGNIKERLLFHGNSLITLYFFRGQALRAECQPLRHYAPLPVTELAVRFPYRTLGNAVEIHFIGGAAVLGRLNLCFSVLILIQPPI